MNFLKNKIFLFAFFFLFFLMSIFFLLRNSILHSLVEKKIAASNKEFGLEIKLGEINFSGINSLVFTDVQIIPSNRDTLFKVEKGSIAVQILPLFIGRLKLSSLNLINPFLQLTQKNGLRNFDFLLKNKVDSSTIHSEINLSILANRLINKALYKVPSKMKIENFILKIVDDSLGFSINATTTIENNEIKSNFSVDGKKDAWTLSGKIFPEDKTLDINFFGNYGPIKMPYIFKKYKLDFGFDTLWTKMNEIEMEEQELNILGSWGIVNMRMKHPKISMNEIFLKNGSLNCKMVIGKNFISIDSSSKMYLKNVFAHPYVKFTLKPEKIYELGLRTEKIPSTDFLNCFPNGLFENLEGIKATGSLQYTLIFKLEDLRPDSLIFNSTLSAENFKIVAFGKENLQKLNASFVYVPYENGRPVRSMLIGPENPNFHQMDDISLYVRNAVLSSEDGSFFWHKGFNEEAFKKSIATNYKEKRFKRGGSTVSMQLVKNVFLNRNKTISRKLEEALIVWLIENNRLVSKSKMYEAYLNLIEWGPNVYGIGEASRFYFAKLPNQLSPGEGIFLASIVPKPKYFRYSFNADGTLKPFVRGYFNLLSGILLRRGELKESDTIQIFESVKLKGPALQFIKPEEAIPDSIKL